MTNRLAHAPKDHPQVKPAKIGVVIANLGTPDATDYWSMRRYLSEFCLIAGLWITPLGFGSHCCSLSS